MAKTEAEPAYFIGEPPEYEARGAYIVGKRNGAEYVFPLPVAQKIVARLNRAIDQCLDDDEGKVVRFPPRRH